MYKGILHGSLLDFGERIDIVYSRFQPTGGQ
jgi:hypothetical protein